MPGIVRVEHRRHPFVIIDRCPLEDERLSWPARGLLGYLLAKPDDWEFRVLDLCRYGDLGRDGVHSLLQQLQGRGYHRRRQVRDERGRVAGYDYTVLEVPHAPGPDSPGPAAPDPAEPDTDEPEPADAPLPSNQGTKDPIDQLTTTTTRTDRGGCGRHARDAGGRSNAGQCPANDSATLEHPPGLSAPETAAARQQLAGVPVDLAQELLDELTARMARGKPSTLQHIEAGRPTEVEIFAGRVIGPGGQHGTPTPIDETAYHVIRRPGG
jgi:hypothetical protein